MLVLGITRVFTNPNSSTIILINLSHHRTMRPHVSAHPCAMRCPGVKAILYLSPVLLSLAKQPLRWNVSPDEIAKTAPSLTVAGAVPIAQRPEFQEYLANQGDMVIDYIASKARRLGLSLETGAAVPRGQKPARYGLMQKLQKAGRADGSDEKW